MKIKTISNKRTHIWDSFNVKNHIHLAENLKYSMFSGMIPTQRNS